MFELNKHRSFILCALTFIVISTIIYFHFFALQVSNSKPRELAKTVTIDSKSDEIHSLVSSTPSPEPKEIVPSSINNDIEKNLQDTFLASHRDTINFLAEIDDSNERGEALDKYSSHFFPALDADREESIHLIVAELYTLSGKKKTITLELLANIAPIEAVDELTEFYYLEEDLKYQQAVIDIFKFTVLNLKGKKGWEEKWLEHRKVKDFFLTNLGYFDPSHDHQVYEAIGMVFPAEEVSEIIAGGQMPTGHTELQSEQRYDHKRLSDDD